MPSVYGESSNFLPYLLMDYGVSFPVGPINLAQCKSCSLSFSIHSSDRSCVCSMMIVFILFFNFFIKNFFFNVIMFLLINLCPIKK